MKRLLPLGALAAVLACAGPARADWDLRASVRYPGASVRDIDASLVKTVERSLRTVDGVRSVRSMVRPERLVTTMRLRGDGRDRRAVRCDVRQLMESLKGEMPAAVSEVRVEDVSVRTYPLVLAFTGDGTDMRELKLRARDFADALLTLADVSDARLVGEEQEILALSVPEGQFLLNCNLRTLRGMIASFVDLPETAWVGVGSRYLRIVADGTDCKAHDVLNRPYTVFCKNGETQTVMLRDNLTVSVERSVRPPENMAGFAGRRAVLVAVSFAPGADPSSVDPLLARSREALPLGVDFDIALDARVRTAPAPFLFDVRLREGTAVETTDAAARLVADVMRKVPGVARVLSVAGELGLPFLPGMEVCDPAPNQAVIVVQTEGPDRASIVRAIAAAVSEKAIGTMVLPRAQTPHDGFGLRVATEVKGLDPDRVRDEADRLAEAARVVPGVNAAYSDWGEQVETLRYKLYESRARQLCLTRKNIGSACRFAIEGIPVTSCWDRGDRLPIVLRIDPKSIRGPQDLSTLWAYSEAIDRVVPFSQVVRGFESVSEPGCLLRKNGLYVATVTAFVEDAASGEAVRKAWAAKFDTLCDAGR